MILVLLCFSLLTCIVSSKEFLIDFEDGNDGNDYSINMDSSGPESSSSVCVQCGVEHECVGGDDYIFNGEATRVTEKITVCSTLTTR